MWCYRRLLRISWTQHKTNEWILRELEVERELLGQVKSLKLGYYGHMTRKYESLEKELIQGCTPGNRSRGRQRRRWTDDIIEWTGLAINVEAGLTQDRDRWTGILHAANPSSEAVTVKFHDDHESAATVLHNTHINKYQISNKLHKSLRTSQVKLHSHLPI